MLLVGIEWNPGPKTVVCNKCGKTVSDIVGHLKQDHPVNKGGRGGKKQDAIKRSIADSNAKEKAAQDVIADLKKELKDLKEAVPKAPTKRDIMNEMKEEEEFTNYKAVRTGPARIFPPPSSDPIPSVFSNRPHPLTSDFTDERIPCVVLAELPQARPTIKLDPDTFSELRDTIPWLPILWVLLRFHIDTYRDHFEPGIPFWWYCVEAILCSVLTRALFRCCVYIYVFRKFTNSYLKSELVMIPLKSVKARSGRDIRPEFDLEQFCATNDYCDYQICVRHTYSRGFIYQLNATLYPKLSSWSEPGFFKTENYGWWEVIKTVCCPPLLIWTLWLFLMDDNVPTLLFKKVRINMGLVSTALNRKTLLGSRSDPAISIATMLRLVAANAHYHDDLAYIRDGRSVYRDMALVCGVIVSRDPYHDNQHF